MYYEKVNTDLRLKLYTVLILENHPDFAKGTPFRQALIKSPGRFNIEFLVEEMFELNCDGQYKFNDGIHEDFTDESEAKTGTLHANGQTSVAEITNVRSANGVLKHGAIRCVMLNPRLKKLHFLFIPQASLKMIMANRKKTKSAMLRYNKKKEQFTTLEKYGIIELDSFKELAMEANR